MDNSKAQALAELKDIHLPTPISWWPLAPGWYFLIILAMIFVFLSAYFYWHWYTRRLSKKQALKILKLYRNQYDKGESAQFICAQISELLKRVALVYFPREQVASLTGKAWVSFLHETGKNTPFEQVRYELSDLPFEKDPDLSGIDKRMNDLFQWSEKWIQQRRKPCLN